MRRLILAAAFLAVAAGNVWAATSAQDGNPTRTQQGDLMGGLTVALSWPGVLPFNSSRTLTLWR